MYKDDYISAFGKLTPSEAWKAETLAKMRALEKQREEGRTGSDELSRAAAGNAPASVSAAAGGKKPAPLAVRLRRAALPIAAVAMLAILPMSALRGCGAGGTGGSMALQMEDAARDSCAPAAAEPRDTPAGAGNGAPAGTPEAALSGGAGLYDGVTEEAHQEISPAQSMAMATMPSSNADLGGGTAADGEGEAGTDALRQKKFETTYGGKPFRALEAAEIAFASVHLAPPDISLEIRDTEALAALLRDAVVYGRDDSYTEYCGQGVTFTLLFKDGTQAQIMAYNPFLVIDGAGYRTEYAPCEALNRYANELLDGGEAVVILQQPPVMTVFGTLDETAHNTLQGGYAWQCKNADGTIADTEAEGAHPLACKTQLSPALEMTYDRTLNLIFPQGAAPDEIVRVRCWSDANWGKTAAKSETVRIIQGGAAEGGYAIALKPGGYIYEVTARWDTADGYGGTASYAFYVKGIE